MRYPVRVSPSICRAILLAIRGFADCRSLRHLSDFDANVWFFAEESHDSIEKWWVASSPVIITFSDRLFRRNSPTPIWLWCSSGNSRKKTKNKEKRLPPKWKLIELLFRSFTHTHTHTQPWFSRVCVCVLYNKLSRFVFVFFSPAILDSNWAWCFTSDRETLSRRGIKKNGPKKWNKEKNHLVKTDNFVSFFKLIWWKTRRGVFHSTSIWVGRKKKIEPASEKTIPWWWSKRNDLLQWMILIWVLFVQSNAQEQVEALFRHFGNPCFRKTQMTVCNYSQTKQLGKKKICRKIHLLLATAALVCVDTHTHTTWRNPSVCINNTWTRHTKHTVQNGGGGGGQSRKHPGGTLIIKKTRNKIETEVEITETRCALVRISKFISRMSWFQRGSASSVQSNKTRQHNTVQNEKKLAKDLKTRHRA